MHSLPLAGSRIAAPAAALALILLAAGCASDDDRPHPPRGERTPAFVPLEGQQTFFHDAITADVLVGALTGFAPGETGGKGEGGGGGHRHHGGGHHLGGGGPGGGGMPGGERGGPDGADGPPAESGAADPGSMEARRADAMGSPPVMIHVRLTNNGTTKADVIIADFLSPLGNFVVTPDHLTLDPGQSLEVEPMASRLAGQVTSGQVTLSLKLQGETETKDVALALKPEAPPPAAAK